MHTYISLLRGINVSGQKLIKMVELKKMFEELGFTDVVTYIQSGNVIFKTKLKDTTKISTAIKTQIMETFGFDVSLLTLTVAELEAVIAANPFEKESKESPEALYITYLDEKPKSEAFKLIVEKKHESELIALVNKVIYLYCPKGYGITKLSNNFIESKLKLGATTRNWKTTTKLLELTKQ